MAVRRTPRSTIALSVAAIAAIYAAGYVETRSVDAQFRDDVDAPLALSSATPVRSVTMAPVSSTATPVPTAIQTLSADEKMPTQKPMPPSATATFAPLPVPPTATRATTYKDGSYQGLGTSRRGDIGVTVTIVGGRIAQVKITSSTTQYPLVAIEDLSRQVVALQSAQVQTISRATYSSQAFRGAVQQALQQAV